MQPLNQSYDFFAPPTPNMPFHSFPIRLPPIIHIYLYISVLQIYSSFLLSALSSEFSFLLSSLFLSVDYSFGTNTTEYQPDTHPLFRAERVPEPNHGEDHGEHFAGYGYGYE